MKYIDCYRALNNHLHTSHTASNVELTNVYSSKRKGLCCSPEVRKNLQTIFQFSDKLFEDHDVNYAFHQVIITQTNRYAGFTVINTPHTWNTYYHLLTESLPCLLEINRTEPIVCMYSTFCLSVLRWFGIRNEIIFQMPIRVRSIIQQPYIECGNPSPQKIQLLRNVIEQKVSFAKDIGILIYRREPYRQILNHDEVLKMLKEKYPHIEWQVFDRLSIDETANLFSKARVIVGPHGAGFTNMIFAPKGIDIIEFMPIESPNVCYWHLSEMLGNHYHIIECNTVNTNFFITPEFFHECNLPHLDT
jgi:capsular polysaccharide biosynthesis protein